MKIKVPTIIKLFAAPSQKPKYFIENQQESDEFNLMALQT